MNDQRRTLWVLMSTSVLASSLALGCGPSPDAGGENGSSGDSAPPQGTPSGGALVFAAGSTNEAGAPSSGGLPLTGTNGAPAVTDDGGQPTTVPATTPFEPVPSSPEAGTPAESASPAVSQPGAMPLISQGLPTYSNYAQSAASNAVDADYSTVWRTGHDPSAADSNWLAID